MKADILLLDICLFYDTTFNKSPAGTGKIFTDLLRMNCVVLMVKIAM